MYFILLVTVPFSAPVIFFVGPFEWDCSFPAALLAFSTSPLPRLSCVMSAAAVPASSAKAMAIPSRVKNPSTGQYIPLSSTPGGSLYGTTPGGTRISYSQAQLLGFRNSPLSKSPALLSQAIINLGVTTESAQAIPEEKLKAGAAGQAASSSSGSGAADEPDDEQFEME
jgi:hypothetical protein